MSNLPEINEQLLAQWMKAALAIAIEGVACGENPFGAGVYHPDGSCISLECNQVISANDPLAHAEMRAISSACKSLKISRLDDFWLVSTAEPCPMCLSAAVIAGITHIAYGATQKAVTKAGFNELGIGFHELAKHIAPEMQIHGNTLENDCSALLYNHRQQNGSDDGFTT